MLNPMNTSRRRALEPSASLHYSSPPPSPTSHEYTILPHTDDERTPSSPLPSPTSHEYTILPHTDDERTPSSPALSLARPRSPSPVFERKRKLEQQTSPRAIKKEKYSTEGLLIYRQFETPSSPPLSPALLRYSPNIDTEQVLGKKRMSEQQTPTRAAKRQKCDTKDLPQAIHKEAPPPPIFFPTHYRSTLPETHNEQTPRTPKHHLNDEYPALLHCTADKEWAPRKKKRRGQRMKSIYRHPAPASSSPITRLVERRRATKQITLHTDTTDTSDTKTPSHKPSLKRTPQKPKTDLPLTTPRPGKGGASDCMYDIFDEDDAESYLGLYQELVVAREEDIKLLRVLVGTIMKSVGAVNVPKH